MPRFITDEILNLYAVIGTYDQIGGKLQQRYGHVVTNVEFSLPVQQPADREILAGLVRDIQAIPPDAARARILRGAPA